MLYCWHSVTVKILAMDSKLTIIQPDDWHLHLRDNDYLATTVTASARYFSRAIIMPNLMPAIATVEQAVKYQARIQRYIPAESNFKALMTLYLTDGTSIKEVEKASQHPAIHAIKLYPQGATTHAEDGVSNVNKLYPLFEAMEKHHLPLLIHGESTEKNVDIFDREKYFIDQTLLPLIKAFPQLNIVLEHITTKDAAEFILSAADNVAATITPHHLLLNRNDFLASGIKPHYYCLPIIKREKHRLALLTAATSGNKKFFLGTDSAPHLQSQKESACGCAGVFTAHAALELYAEIFSAAGKLQNLEKFASINGANFYKLPINSKKIILKKTAWQAPEKITFAEGNLIPFRAGDFIQWQVLPI